MRESPVRIVGGAIMLIGLAGLLCGIGITPSFAERYLSSDGQITSRGLEILRGYRLTAVIAGASMFVGGLASLLAAPALADHFREEPPTTIITDDAARTGRRQLIVWALIIVAAVAAYRWMLWITTTGPGVSPDSVTYIRVAQNLLAGEGFSSRGQPMTHYPPAYPMLVSITSVLHRGYTVEAARFLAALLFGVNASLLGFSVAMCTDYDISAVSCILLFTLFSASTLSVHSMAWTEAPFIMLSMVAFILLSVHVARSSQHLYLLASVFAAGAIATRYVGVTLLPPMALTLLVFGHGTIKHRLKEALISLTLALLPLAAWVTRNALVAQTATNRTLAIHPVGLGHVLALAVTTYEFVQPLSRAGSGWMTTLVLPLAGGISVLGLALTVGISLFGLASRRVRRHIKPSLIVFSSLSVAFCLTYLSFLAISISFFDAHTPVNNRILLPILLPLTAAGVSVVQSVSRVLGRRIIWFSFLLFALLCASFNALTALPLAIEIHTDGRGYTARHWQDSPTLSYLATTPDSKRIYSNGASVVWFVTQKEATSLPAKTHPTTRRPNENYDEQLRKVLRGCREGEALIAYLDGITHRWYLPSVEELETKGSLPVLQRFEDGVVYGRD